MQRIIVDTDLGIDDALALLYLLASPEARIEAITTVHGNVPVDIATRNVFEVLTVAGVSAPPDIARGSAIPLASPGVHATEVHGNDGLGGWTSTGKAPLGQLHQQPANELICDRARQYPGEITLLLIGPATNAALAFQKDPEGFRLLKNIVLMGGTVTEPGNITAMAEFNVYADPEAACEVIRSAVPLVMVGLDVTRKVSLTRQVLREQLGLRNDRKAQFLRCITEQGFSFYKNISGWDGFFLHDPLAAAVALDNTLVQTRRMKLDIETTGEFTRGMVVAERRPWITGGKNTDVCVSVDGNRFMAQFRDRVLGGEQTISSKAIDIH